MTAKKTPKENEKDEKDYIVLQPISVDNKTYKVDDPITLADIKMAESLISKSLIAEAEPKP